MLKRIIPALMILAMVVSLFSGCASVNQEESASVGELVEGSPQEDFGDQTDDFQEDDQAQKPSADEEDEINDQDQNFGNGDQDPDSDEEKPDMDPDKDSDVSDGKDSSEEPDADEKPEQVDPDAEGSGWYKVLSFNIKSMWYNPETKQTGPDMREETVRIMREIDADIVGLQEVDCIIPRSFNVDQPKWLAEQLGYEHYYFTNTVKKDGGDYGHAILSRFPIKKIEEGTYKEQNNELRKYTRVVLDIAGQEVVYINTHLCTQESLDDDTRDSTIGQAQFREVASIIQNEKRPALMTADYNLPIKTQFKLYDRSKMTSMNGGKTQTKLHDMIGIDNIYVNNMLDYYVDGEGMSVFVGMETSSDHDPLWSYFKLK